MEKWLALITPENVQYASVLLGAAITGVLWLFGKKAAAESLWGRVKRQLEDKVPPTLITDRTKATISTVAAVAKELEAEKSPEDTNRKKAQRAFRKIFRGFILSKI